jgi:sugar O-acyltransferase (sialic acid O-acetyltransferase NeuD family)
VSGLRSGIGALIGRGRFRKICNHGETALEKEKVVIFGTTELAVMCHFYFTNDSTHEVIGFTVDRAFIKEKKLCGLPVVPFEDVESIYPPGDYKMFVAIWYGRVNRTRAEKYSQAKEKGYDLISYVSSKSSTWPGLVLGDNCLILEGSVVGPFAEIGNNVTIAGSIVGHHSIIKDHCFLAAHSVVLGQAIIEPYCFLGANSTIREEIVLGKECIIGAGAIINKSTPERAVYIPEPATLLPQPSNLLSKWLTWGRK